MNGFDCGSISSFRVFLAADELHQDAPQAEIDDSDLSVAPGGISPKPFDVFGQMRNGGATWTIRVQARLNRSIDFGLRTHESTDYRNRYKRDGLNIGAISLLQPTAWSSTAMETINTASGSRFLQLDASTNVRRLFEPGGATLDLGFHPNSQGTLTRPWGLPIEIRRPAIATRCQG